MLRALCGSPLYYVSVSGRRALPLGVRCAVIMTDSGANCKRFFQRAEIFGETPKRASLFEESVFPKAFEEAAQNGYMESQEAYASLFKDGSKYEAVMRALAGIVYREMRKSR